MQMSAERRCEFRFPVILPVEYVEPDEASILSYSLDLSKRGTFISSDDPLTIGSRFGMRLTVPFNWESSKIFRMEGTVAWNKIQPFKSKRNGMGVYFVEPFPDALLLSALADAVQKLMRESEAKRLLEERVKKLETGLEEAERLAALGRCVEKILFEVSNPIVALSGQLEIIKAKMHGHKRMLEGHGGADKEGFRYILEDFDKSCKKIDRILKDYRIISELAHIAGYDRETIERRLRERYKC
jgi:signal transduction histidine kinase